ncbi:MAG: DUF134 domain-containing protein [Candidatus Omnitrophica bacterium]|nr:DUF134 domain-containing protein [Candidatus Omnitrophota bacterium]
MRKGRRKKVRYIQKMPKTAQFSPRGNPGRPDEAELNIDHYEAIKLADHQGYNQTEGANAMGVSRPTFGRILREGRKIVADALANGKIIRIRTGDVQVGIHHKILPHKNTLTAQNVITKQKEEAVRGKMFKFRHNAAGTQTTPLNHS